MPGGGPSPARTAPLDDAERVRTLDRTLVWHPYTQMQEYAASQPVVIQRGQGRRLQDVDGRWYWDGVSSIWLNVHGHRVPEIDAAVREQLDEVAHSTLLGQGNVPAAELAAELVEVAPRGLGHVLYSDNGSCAIEAALKMALQYWVRKGRPEKSRILSFEGGYHGDTLGAVGLAPVPTFHSDFAHVLPEPLQAPYPDCYRDPGTSHPRGCVDEHLRRVEAVLRAHAKTVAALFVEPLVQGVAGIRLMPRGFLKGLRDLCDRYEVLLAADEVATGFGRTARMWACDHEEVRPDLLAMGKGLTGGYLPLAGTLATDEIYASFLGAYAEKRAFFHGHSFTGNQLACAAARASLRLLRQALPSLPEKAEHFMRRLAGLRTHPFVGDLRVLGFLAGADLVVDRKAKTPFPWETRAAWHVADAARRRGLLVRPIGNVSLLIPPIGSTRDELDAMTDAFQKAHTDATPSLERLMAAATVTAAGASAP